MSLYADKYCNNISSQQEREKYSDGVYHFQNKSCFTTAYHGRYYNVCECLYRAADMGYVWLFVRFVNIWDVDEGLSR